jgi:hypothetical protein
MPMTLEQKLSRVRLRCAANIALDYLAQSLTAAGIVVLAGILCQRLIAMPVIQPWTVWALAGACIALVAGASWLKRPTVEWSAVAIDKRAGLKERFSTALALGASGDEFAVAACREAHKAVEQVDVTSHFPVRPSREWFFTCSAWAIVLVAFFLVPQKDIFGFLKHKQDEQSRVAQVQQTQAAIQQATIPVAMAVKQLNDSKLDAALAALGDMPGGQPPEVAKQEAIRKLGDIADKLKDMRTDPSHMSVDALQEMLKQLKGSQNELARNMQLALAKGDFAKASQIIREMQKQIESGSMTAEQKQLAAEGLKELAKQLGQAAKKSDQMEKELEKQGLDKKLAKLPPEQLKQALQKQGLDQKKIDELSQKAAACQSASAQASALSEAMQASAGSGELSMQDMQALAGSLDKLDNFQQQAQLSEAVLKQIEIACNSLGDALGEDGEGGQGPWQSGSSDRYGGGTGGPGKGYGARSGDKEGNTSTSKTRVETASKAGPVVASWYVKGEQVKGEPLRNYSEIVQAGRDSAAEAISENRIPRKYEESIKEYFGDIEKAEPAK